MRPAQPESPERLQAVLQTLKAPEFLAAAWRGVPLASFDQVLYVHTPYFVAQVQLPM